MYVFRCRRNFFRAFQKMGGNVIKYHCEKDTISKFSEQLERYRVFNVE
jgi:hypothetical protein